nr:isoamylase early set domain-containing protein [Chloroflexota bacterium]
MIYKRASTDPNKIIVRFELPSAIWADSVHLVGDFNNWNESSHPMIRDRDEGTWYIVLELERGKEYQFRYLVNGREWHNDWKADKYVPNLYGGTNSVVCAELPPADESVAGE